MAQAAVAGGRVVYVDPVTDRRLFAMPPGAPGAALVSGPRHLSDHPRPPVPVTPVITLPPPPGTIGRLKTLPGGRMVLTPTNLPAIAAAAGPPAPNVDPPPGTNVIIGQADGSYVVNPLPAAFAADDAGQINAACLQAQQLGADTANGQNPGARVILGYGLFNLKSGIVKPASVALMGQGAGSRLMQNFTGTGVYAHRTAGYGGQFGNPAQQGTGYIRDFVLDGSGAGPGSIGLDVGDGIGIDVRGVQCVNYSATSTFNANAAGVLTLPAGVSLPNGLPVIMQGNALPGTANPGFVYYVANSAGNTCTLQTAFGGTGVTFSGAGSGVLLCSIGMRITDYIFWSEKSYGYNVLCSNNAIQVVMDTTNPGGGGGDVSLEYNEVILNMFCNAGQQGLAVAGGANLGGVRLWTYGNMSGIPNGLTVAQTGCAWITFSGMDSGGDSPSRLYSGELHMKAEGNPGNGQNGVYPYAILCATGNEYVRSSAGHITHSLSNSLLNGGEFSFNGMALDDTGLSGVFPSNFVSGTQNAPGTQAGQPTVPPSGKKFLNYSMAQTVYITAGTAGCTVTKNGAAVTFAAGVTLPFTMNAAEELSLTYTNAPTWVWVPAAAMLSQ